MSTSALDVDPLVMSSIEENAVSSVNELPTNHPSFLLKSQVAVNEEEDESRRYLSGFKLYIIVFGLSVSVLVVALVRTGKLAQGFSFANIAPGQCYPGYGMTPERFGFDADKGQYLDRFLILSGHTHNCIQLQISRRCWLVWKRISNHHVSVSAWRFARVESLTSDRCACQPLSGKIYQHFSLKWAYLSFLFVFEIGSLVCATAPSSVVRILGRAIAGLGAAGLFSGALVIVARSTL